MIPVVLLGDKTDRKLYLALRQLLAGRCSTSGTEGFCWKSDADVLLVEQTEGTRLDVGGGLIVVRENFLPQHAPAHLLHAQYVIVPNTDQARRFAAGCGLPVLSCGGRFDSLSFASTQEQTVLTLQQDVRLVDGQKLPAGDYPAELAAELEGSDLLLCAAVLLLLGEELNPNKTVRNIL